MALRPARPRWPYTAGMYIITTVAEELADADFTAPAVLLDGMVTPLRHSTNFSVEKEPGRAAD